jgi:hypothetical protein
VLAPTYAATAVATLAATPSNFTPTNRDPPDQDPVISPRFPETAARAHQLVIARETKAVDRALLRAA